MTVSQRSASPHLRSSTWPVHPAPSDASDEQSFGAEFRARAIGSDVIQIFVAGDVDIRNALALRDFTSRYLESSRIVLDLSVMAARVSPILGSKPNSKVQLGDSKTPSAEMNSCTAMVAVMSVSFRGGRCDLATNAEGGIRQVP